MAYGSKNVFFQALLSDSDRCVCVFQFAHQKADYSQIVVGKEVSGTSLELILVP